MRLGEKIKEKMKEKKSVEREGDSRHWYIVRMRIVQSVSLTALQIRTSDCQKKIKEMVEKKE